VIGIVGGGLATGTLVESYREAGGADDITIWSRDDWVPYHRPPLSKRLLRGEAEAEDTFVLEPDWYTQNNVELHLDHVIDSIDDINADTIVLATGARPREFPGASTFRWLDDALELRARAREAESAVVIGGGFIGCEITASLTQLGVHVTHVVREPMLFANLQAPPLSEALHETYREHGVDLRLESTEIPEADLTVAGVGVVPNVELALAAGLQVRSGIVVDERFATERPGVYAIGDAAEFYDPIFHRYRRIEHWSNAAYHGTTLGRILAGADERYDIVSAFFSEEFGQSFRYLGDPEGHDSTALEGDFREGKAVFRFLHGSDVLGAVIMGQSGEAEAALKEEIRAGAATLH
jgi:3-phenylpropionate/trans-cinnamate dioxygenase ferredoxin reductase component